MRIINLLIGAVGWILAIIIIVFLGQMPPHSLGYF
jgi:type IV secretory pathway VirB2 component (pilin)